MEGRLQDGSLLPWYHKKRENDIDALPDTTEAVLSPTNIENPSFMSPLVIRIASVFG